MRKPVLTLTYTHIFMHCRYIIVCPFAFAFAFNFFVALDFSKVAGSKKALVP